MPLAYVGRPPDSDAVLVTKKYADDANAAVAVTTDYVAAQATAQITNFSLQQPAYVDAQDALRAHKTQVDAADANYFPTTALNNVNGVAGLDANGNLLSAQIPAGIRTDRVAFAVTGTNILGSGSTQKALTTNVRETAIATLTVNDPGFPWRPLVFALAQGASVDGSAPASRANGNGIYGRLVAIPPTGVSDTVYAAAICTASPYYNFYVATPYAAPGQTPATIPAISGSLQIDLYASCHLGSGYTFKGLGLAYWALIFPAVGT